MARSLAVGVLLPIGVTAGCAQLAGLDPTTGDGRQGVSLAFVRESLGASVVMSPQDVTTSTATYLVPDATDPTGLTEIPAQANADTWTADIAEGTPAVLFTLPDYPVPFPRLWQIPNRSILGLYAILEHPDPTPAPANATITVQVGLDAPYAGESFQTYSLGSWTQRGFAAAELPAMAATQLGPVTFPFSSTASLTGRPFEKLTTADAFLVLRYAASQLTGVLEATPFDQTGADMVTGAMAAVPADQPYTATIDPPTAVTRYLGARPAMAGFAIGWVVVAAPGYGIWSMSGPQLAAGTPLGTDTMISMSYGNPFLAHDWRSLMQYGTSESRTYMPAGQTLPMTVTAGLYEIFDPQAGTPLDLPAGLPITITLDGHPLVSDGMTIAQPTAAITASFQTDVPDNTYYQLNLYELVPNAAGTALQYQIALAMAGLSPSFTIPPGQLLPGKIYVMRAITYQGGFSALGDGNLRERSLPVGVGYLDSGIFTVTP